MHKACGFPETALQPRRSRSETATPDIPDCNKKNHKAAGSAGGGSHPIVPASHKAFLPPPGKTAALWATPRPEIAGPKSLGTPQLEEYDSNTRTRWAFSKGVMVALNKQFHHNGTRARSNRQIGRWLQHNPIGYAGGINLYEYVGGRAMVAKDPEGRQYTPRTGDWIACAGGRQVYLDAGCDVIIPTTKSRPQAAIAWTTAAKCIRLQFTCVPDCPPARPFGGLA